MSSTEPTIAERAAAYRADQYRSNHPELQHENVRLFSPGFAFLGLVTPSYNGKLRYIDFRQPILTPASWIQHRTTGPNAAERNQRMTLRWRRI